MPYTFGSKDESIFMERVFTASTTWTPPFNCRAYVTVIGPGGSGASRRNTSNGTAMAASGGGAGGCAKSLLDLSASVTYTITVGAGGASVQGANGNNGGANSVFSGSDITDMTANLGNGGSQSGGTGTVSSQAGGTGGAASGGNLWNVTGGAGGSAEISSWSSNGDHYASGGGGAAGILGTAYRGGNALCSTAGWDRMALGGGAGVGGRGGDATVTAGNGGSGDNWPQVMGSGGFGWRDGFDATASTATAVKAYGPWQSNKWDVTCNAGEELPWANSGQFSADGDSATQMYDSFNMSHGMTASIFHGIQQGQPGGGGQPGSSRMSSPGGGGSGYWSAGSTTYAYGNAGLFGGGAGCSTNYHSDGYSSQNGYGFRGSIGAGGGGITAYAASSNVTMSGKGGPGMVVVTILEVL